MTQDVFEFFTYLCCGVVDLVLGIVLLGVRFGYSDDSDKDYFVVKKFVAFASFLEVLVFIAILALQIVGTNFLMVNHFLAPLVLFFQLFMCASAMLHFMRFPRITQRNQTLLLLPVLLIAFVHYAGFFVKNGLIIDVQEYTCYVHDGFSNTLRYLLLLVITVDVCFLGTWLVQSCIRYNKMLRNYYSGNELVGNKKLMSVRIAFFMYFLLGGINLLWLSELASAIIMLVITVLFCFFVIDLINLQSLFSAVSPAFTYQQELIAQDIENELKKEEVNIVNDVKNNAKSSSFESIVTAWKENENKYFMRDGLTLGDTADQMGLNPRHLSDFLNSVYGMNFNLWINSLRVEEIRKMLDAGNKSSLSELAHLSGFTDASALSKAFKKIVGVSPTQYKAALALDSQSSGAES
mgnify:FL=1